MNKAKKVIILDKIHSSAISQAIFILRDNEEDEFFALEEAERLVSDYIVNKTLSRNKSSFYIIGILFCVLLVAFLIFCLNF